VINFRVRPDTYQTTQSSHASQEAHGARSETGRVSAKVPTTPQYIPHVGANPPSPGPPRPPKPDELKREVPYMWPPRTGRNADPNREGSYSHPPPLNMAQVTTSREYPSPGPSPPRGQTLYHSPTGSPDTWNQDYPSSSFPYPKPQFSAPHHAPPFKYPSPEATPPGNEPHHGGSHPSQGKLNYLLRPRRVC